MRAYPGCRRMFSIAVCFCSEQTSLFRCTSFSFGEPDTEHPPTSRIGSEILLARKVKGLPTVRTINRILRRSGAFDGQSRVHRRPPPTGWYLSEVAAERREPDCLRACERIPARPPIDQSGAIIPA
jgi:hypothetical protein